MVYSDPFVHLSITDSHVNYDLPRMRGNETPSDWKDRIWDTLMCNVWKRLERSLRKVGYFLLKYYSPSEVED
ncbi:unnamed protein product [Rhizophagus irregularis]|nr:unnamed protein product [Rhizophagus irregularis]